MKRLVVRMAVQTGMAAPARRPRSGKSRDKGKEDGIRKSQKILLTWLIEDAEIFNQISKYITPEDFSDGLCRTVAGLLYEQYEEGEVNPAKIMNHFVDEEEHREVAGLFHTKIRELSTPAEREKALRETIIRVKNNSIEEAGRNWNAADIEGMQRLVKAKSDLQNLRKLHISVN